MPYPKRIFLTQQFIGEIVNLNPTLRCVAINERAKLIGVSRGALYNHLRENYGFKKIGKYWQEVSK